MAKVKLNLRGLSVPEKIARAQQIVASMTGNANFPTPQPALAQVTSTFNELNTAFTEVQAARQEAKTRTTILSQKEDAADRVLMQLSSYVESVSGGDEAIIQSASLDVRATSTPGGTPDAPEALNATQGEHAGEIDLQWDKVERARSYIIEKSADPPSATSWTHAAVATRSRVTIEGLASGTTYWFRVAAIGTDGQSGWSNPAAKIAP